MPWNDGFKDRPRSYHTVCCSCCEPFSPALETRSGVCVDCNKPLCERCLEGNEQRLCLYCQPPEGEWEGEDPFFYPSDQLLFRHGQLARAEKNARARKFRAQKKLKG